MYISTHLYHDSFLCYIQTNRAEFSEIINRDLTFAMGSIVFVYFYIWLQTGSAFIALVGMTEILISLPSAYFVYRFIFQFEFFAAFNAMVSTLKVVKSYLCLCVCILQCTCVICKSFETEC